MNTIQINGLPLSLAFHAFDPHLVIANESDMITYVACHDWMVCALAHGVLPVCGIGSSGRD